MTVPIKDDQREGPVADAWRPTLTAIAASIERDDTVIAAGLPNVDPVSEELSADCRNAVRRYGDVTLVALPESAWDTAVCLWQGDRWHCLVDLWTQEEGRSDLSLDVDVFEQGKGYRYSVNLVYVP